MADQKNKIVQKNMIFLCHAGHVGGVEYVTYQHAKYAKQLGYNVSMFYVTKGFFSNKVEDLGIKCYDIKLTISSEDFIPIIKVLDPDVIYISNCPEFLPKVGHFNKAVDKKAKVIFPLHSTIEWCTGNAFAYKHVVNKFLVIHDGIKKALLDLKIPESQIQVVPNWIEESIPLRNMELNKKIRTQYKIDSDTTVIGMLTRLHDDKNPWSCAKIMKKILQKGKYHLLIIGDGPQKQDILNFASDNKFQDKITITGFLKPGEAYDIMHAMDICMNNSTMEGLPISLLEALAMGLYCIYPTVGGIPTVMPDKYSSLVNIKPRLGGSYADIEEQLFADEIVRVQSLDIRSMIKQIRAHIMDLVSVTKLLPSYTKLLED
jgi:glycosyltransferase involved in cell wall biosynthesis